jgi:hypothetical protein
MKNDSPTIPADQTALKATAHDGTDRIAKINGHSPDRELAPFSPLSPRRGVIIALEGPNRLGVRQLRGG